MKYNRKNTIDQCVINYKTKIDPINEHNEKEDKTHFMAENAMTDFDYEKIQKIIMGLIIPPHHLAGMSSAKRQRQTKP